MTIGRFCCRQVDTAALDETVQAAAQRMGNRGVGTLVVTDASNRPAGILTDRDIVVRAVGARRDPASMSVGDTMTSDVHTAFEDMATEDALKLMRTESVRRLVVVRHDGSLVGIVSLDDILIRLSDEMREVGDLVRTEAPEGVLAAN